MTAAGDRPEVVGRTEWGADDDLRFDDAGNLRFAVEYHRVAGIVIHHTGAETAAHGPAAALRRLQWFHSVRRGWADVGYHFVIDAAGAVYEGRHTSDLWGDGGTMVVGAHAKGFNYGTVGIALLGDLSHRPCTDAAWSTLEHTVGALVTAHGIDPVATEVALAPNGRVLPAAIVAHGDIGPTSCPGGGVTSRLPMLRQALGDQRLNR